MLLLIVYPLQSVQAKMKRSRVASLSACSFLLTTFINEFTTAFLAAPHNRASRSTGIDPCAFLVSQPPPPPSWRPRTAEVDEYIVGANDEDTDNYFGSTFDAELEQRRVLHALLESADPEWYQEYVLDPLRFPPQDCNYPAVLHYSLVSTKAPRNIPATDVQEQQASQNASTPTGEPTANSSCESHRTMDEIATNNHDEKILSEAVESQTDAASASKRVGGSDDCADLAASNIATNLIATDPLASTPATILTTRDLTLDSANTTTVSILADLPQNMDELADKGIATNLTTLANRDEERRVAADVPVSVNDDATIMLAATTSISTKRTTPKPLQVETCSNSATQATAATSEETSKMIIYKDSKEGWKMIESKQVLELGYMEEELAELLPDALAIIVQKQIRRPRTLGLPAPWRVGPEQRQSKLKVVANKEAAEGLLDSLRADEITSKSKRAGRTTRTSVVSPQNISAKKETKNEEIVSRGVPVSEVEGFAQDTENATVVAYQSVAPTALGTNDKIDSSVSEPKFPAEEDRTVLYRDLSKSLALVPLTNLTGLGYLEEEILSLQSEALAIIVADQVTRPREGIPPQWTMKVSTEASEVHVVESRATAQMLAEDDKIARRRWQVGMKQSVTGRPTASKEEAVGETDDDFRKFASARSDDSSVGPPRQRQPQKKEAVKLRKSTADEAPRQAMSRQDKNDDSYQNQRQRSRRREMIDGSSKRIYNAREIQTRQEKSALADPPDPMSPIWIGMDSFRSLLRNEAELRLRILGDDWAPTVKQESEWRLALYKKWLWTLHNGVGDSIVPPSRYERARKVKEQRMRDEDPESSNRSQSENEPTRKIIKKRPQDKEK
jgi:hypothetical protein